MLLRCIVALALLCSVAVAVAPAQTPGARRAADDRDMQELKSFTLTMDNVTRTYQTLFAIGQAMKADPELQQGAKANESSKDDNDQTFNGMAAKLSKSPKIVAIISAHGFTPRTLALTFFSILQTGIAIAALDAGATMADITSKGEANAANIHLLRSHKADLEALQAKYPMQDGSE